MALRTLGGQPASAFDYACAAVAPHVPPLLQPCLNTIGAALRETRRDCAERARITVSFFPKRRGDRQFPLPMVRPHRCNVALVDAAFDRALHGSNGWRVVVVDPICWPNDPPRSAHFVKTALPLLLPWTRWSEYGDANKCETRNKEWPSRSLTSRSSPPGDVIAVRHYHDERLGSGLSQNTADGRWNWSAPSVDPSRRSHRTVAAEFLETRQHLRARQMGTSVFADMAAQEAWYGAQGFGFERGFVNDAMCLAWRNSSLARHHACVWSSEILYFSMREQATARASRERVGSWRAATV